jgi:ABC-type multidrug transport system ATPase subunit
MLSAQAAILDSLKELAAGRTCLFVAHRLSTVAHCDRILVMDAGLIVEEGTHEELVQKGGAYSRMWSLQQAEKKDEPEESGHVGEAGTSGRSYEYENGLSRVNREDRAHSLNGNGASESSNVDRSLANSELKEEKRRSKQLDVVVEESVRRETEGAGATRVDDLMRAVGNESE